ncbi:MAG: hypothetical protein FWG65_05945 [Turicibacter sp.]|nr:hypothetical protein [Turicibacter sp.]
MPQQSTKTSSRIILAVFVLMPFMLFLVLPIITTWKTNESVSAQGCYATERTFIQEEEKRFQQANHQAFLIDAWWWIDLTN